MSFTGAVIRLEPVPQDLYPGALPDPTHNGTYYEGEIPVILAQEFSDYVYVGEGGTVVSGVGGSNGTNGSSISLLVSDWNNVGIIDSFLMPSLTTADESCPDTTVLTSEQCGSLSSNDESCPTTSVFSLATATLATITDE